MSVTVHSPSGVHPTAGYSHAVTMGGLVFVAGQVARNEAGDLVGKGDARAQTEQIWANLKAVLEATGSGLDLIGKITIYVTSLDFRPAIAEVRDRIFAPIGHFPASTFVVVSSLASPDFLVEIEAVAALR